MKEALGQVPKCRGLFASILYVPAREHLGVEVKDWRS